MTDYWVSNERHYCKECGCWMDGKASSIRKHEEGFRHKGNVERLLKKLKRDKIFKQRESNKHNAEFAAIERAAKRQYIKDCANGLTSSQYGQLNTFNHSNNNNHNLRRKDNKTNLFLGTDNDIYYYLDKDGVVHGPYTSSKMCIWYHFGFFVGALRIRKREETQFIHLRDIKNPFNYIQFEKKLNTNVQFRKNVINSIDISNANTVPPGIDIPQKLKDEFYKLYPLQNNKNDNDNDNNKSKTEKKYEAHKYYSNGIHFNGNNNNNGMTKREQRKIFVRGHMRKYKMKCNCGDSDCHIKHNKEYIEKEDIEKEEENVDIKYVKKSKEKKEDKKREDVDEFGFGKWETVTKAEFDKKHSNQHLFKQKENSKKRWWRDQINSNLPIAKRKKFMGIDEMASDEERDYDEQYGINEILKQKELMENEQQNNDNIHNQYNQSNEKIAISISNKFKINVQKNNNNDNNINNQNDDILLNEEDIMIKNAKLKLKKMKEEQLKANQERKQKMLQTLDECVNDQNNKISINNQVDQELRIQQEIDNSGGALFKKKKKKKNRQRGKIVTSMR